MSEVVKNKRLVILGCIALVFLIVACMILGKSNKKEEAEQEYVVETQALELDNLQHVKVKLELADAGVYQIGLINGKYYVFRNNELKGSSAYSVVANDIKDYSDVPAEDINIEEYKDEQINGLYKLSNDKAIAYINYLKQSGYEEKARVYMDTYIEGILDSEQEHIRYIVANNSLMMYSLDSIEKFGPDYFIDKYIY